LENTICKLNEVFGEQEEYHKSLEELITAYGTRRIHTKDSTAWINFRGCYSSKSFNDFWKVYLLAIQKEQRIIGVYLRLIH